jgi:hypothetical protein
MLAASFPTLRLPAWTCADRFRPRSGACHRCFHLRPSGEASQPGLRAPAGTLTPNPARTLLRFGCVRSTSARSASRLSVGDRWPCATGLASYPSSCIHHLNRTTPFSVPPVARILSRLRGHRRVSRRLPLGSLNPRRPASLFTRRLRHRKDSAASIQFVQNRWMADHHTGSQ